jgi:TonB family protein
VGERLLAYVATLNLPPGQIERATASVQDRFGYNAAAVTRDTYNTNRAQWESAIQQETGLATLTAAEDRTDDFSAVYPQRVCLVEEPGEIKIGALVNPDGSWRGAPRLLRSSGYAALDRKALQDIQSHRFTPADSITAYVLTVSTTVDYGRRPCIPATPGP